MAWVMIGEYSLHFRDYVLAAFLVVTAAVILGLQSNKLYEMEDELPEVGSGPGSDALKRKKRSQLYVGIFLFEGVAIMATWMILLRLGHEDWLVAAFALVAGLHFIPLARVTHIGSYYVLAAWLCALAGIGYWLLLSGMLTATGSNVLIAYGCAAGAIADGALIVVGTRRAFGRTARN